MSTSRTVRRRKQSEARRHKQADKLREQTLAITPRVTRPADALAAANALLETAYPELHERGHRFEWAESDDFRCPACGYGYEEIPTGHAWNYQDGGSCQQPPKLTRAGLDAMLPDLAIADVRHPENELDEAEEGGD